MAKVGSFFQIFIDRCGLLIIGSSAGFIERFSAIVNKTTGGCCSANQYLGAPTMSNQRQS
jgi:hypothetical protein